MAGSFSQEDLVEHVQQTRFQQLQSNLTSQNGLNVTLSSHVASAHPIEILFRLGFQYQRICFANDPSFDSARG